MKILHPTLNVISNVNTIKIIKWMVFKHSFINVEIAKAIGIANQYCSEILLKMTQEGLLKRNWSNQHWVYKSNVKFNELEQTIVINMEGMVLTIIL